MNKNLIAAAVMSLPVLVACENRDPEMNNPGELTLITATICDAEPSTRSAIDPTEYAGGHVGILWTPEDIVGVYSTDDKNIPFRNQSETAIGRTQFAGECSNPRYAYYPYHEENATSDMTAVKGNLSAEQTFDSSTGAISGDYKYGTPSATTPGEFTFKHIFSLLRFNLDITGINALSGESLKSVTLTLPEGRKLAGDFTFDITSGNYTFTGNTSNAVTMRWADMPQLEENKTYQAYMSCAPDMKVDDVIMVTVTTSRHTASFSAKIAYDFEANTVYTFNLKLSDFNDGAHGFVVEELPVEPEEETANCYMITTAGEHDFKATVIGNGEKGIIKGAGFHTENPYINPQSAKLLWEDTQGFITDVTLRDGRVHYTTTGNVGNAVIAVYSGANATGDILWSWHIWGVGDTLPADEEITNYNGHKFTIMSRNIGDRSDKKSYGVLYQWGRKDPVSSDSIIYVNGVETTTDDPSTYRYRWIERLAKADESKSTIAYSILDPMRMVTLESGDDWLCEENLKLWGNSYTSDEQGNQETEFTDNKTIYDPSPVGYRVANSRTFTFFCKNSTGSTPGGVAASSKLNRINYVKFDGGYYFKRNEADTEGVWFPQTGRRDGYFLDVTTYTGNGNKRRYYTSVGETGYCWYSNPAAAASGAGRALMLSIYNYIPNDGSVSSNNSLNCFDIRKRSSACAVRCVREK